jgi:hypothetical protein
MSDPNLAVVLQVNVEIQGDPGRPTFAREIDVFDEVDCEIAMLEADNQVDEYMEKFRARFSDPEVFENFVMVYRIKFRGEIKVLIDAAREIMEAAGKGPKDITRGEEYHKDDDDGNV